MFILSEDALTRSKFSLANFLDFGSSGIFSFLSYRDPNLLKTLDVYDGTSGFLKELEMDEDALTKAIIGTIGDVDSYQLPDAKGYSRQVDDQAYSVFILILRLQERLHMLPFSRLNYFATKISLLFRQYCS